ncbi:MAG: trypsin-like peptidase domain-containing protein [Candidatus Electryonea clarkiae]|nr:trypsin-like peptidase domain-containing protein [Candidatus Electryonea clarkiae]MDP8286343.1 trypsin-like peptidase domain-containing protein [Candidatus Electryonea clarkiae]
MKRLILWFIIGLLIGAGSMGLVLVGAFLERQNENTLSSGNISAAGSIQSSEKSDSASIKYILDSESNVKNELKSLINNATSLGRNNAITRVIQDVSPAVVGINVIQVRVYQRYDPWFNDPLMNHFFGIPKRQFEQKVENLGSGFIISPDGYAITNEHVVHQASEIIVTMTTGEKFQAKHVGSDYDCDIALLKIDGDDFPWIPVSEDNDVMTGEWAIAIGNPFGLFQINDKPSVSVGVISAVGRDFTRQLDGRLYRGMIQTDAAINPGNSGGPLLNILGKVIGVNAFIYSPSQSSGSVGIGFAIPAYKLREVVKELKAREGKETHFWTGLEVQGIDRWIAQSLGFNSIEGVIVTNVDRESPADKAGFISADILFEIEGTRISNTLAIKKYFDNRDLRVGDELEMKVFRKGNEIPVMLKLEARPK